MLPILGKMVAIFLEDSMDKQREKEPGEHVHLDLVKKEIEELHEFFCEWFGGSMSESLFESEFLNRFSEDLVSIPPAGRYLSLHDISKSVRAGYNTNPQFRVQIRNVKITQHLGDYIVATYEEWQRNALASTPPDNGRVATVLFHSGDRLRWLHIHETWLPEEIMEADSYDF